MTVYSSSGDEVRQSLDQAIADARAGRRDDAVRRLRQIVRDDPANVDAWIWLGGTAPDAAEQRRALERALELAPQDSRAQQGLQWLHDTSPEAFERPTPAREEQPWVRRDAVTPRANPLNDIAERADAPTQVVDRNAVHAQPNAVRSYEQPTQHMPVRQPSTPTVQPPRRPEPPMQRRPVPPLARTEAMRMAPDAIRQRPQRSLGANIARWLLTCIWSIGLGVALVATAIGIFALTTDPVIFDSVVSEPLRSFGVAGNLAGARLPIVAGLAVLVLIDVLVVLGLFIGRVWAWRIALLVALATFFGAVALLVLAFVLSGTSASLSLNDPLTQTLLGLVAFTLVLLLLTLASRRAFRRSEEEAYGR